MDRDTKQAAVWLLRANRSATEHYEATLRGLRSTRLHLIAAARRHGMTWDEIAQHLEWSDGHALRMWYRRSGGKD